MAAKDSGGQDRASKATEEVDEAPVEEIESDVHERVGKLTDDVDSLLDEIDDVLAPQLQAAAGRQRGHPAAFLKDNHAVFGDLADDPRFTRVYRAILTSLFDQGVRKTLADLDQYA